MDLNRPPAADDTDRADAYAAAPLLNCLLREVAEPLSDSSAPGTAAGPLGPGADTIRTYRLPGVDRLLRVRGDRRPADPEVYTAGAWHRVGHTELVKLVTEDLRRDTRLANHELPAEMIASRSGASSDSTFSGAASRFA